MPPDIKQISESIQEEGEFAEPGFTFSTQKAIIWVPKIMENSENKQRGSNGTRRDDLLDDIELSFIKELSDSRKKGNIEKENIEDLFCKCLASDLKEMHLYERLNAKN